MNYVVALIFLLVLLMVYNGERESYFQELRSRQFAVDGSQRRSEYWVDHYLVERQHALTLEQQLLDCQKGVRPAKARRTRASAR